VLSDRALDEQLALRSQERGHSTRPKEFKTVRGAQRVLVPPFI